MRFTQEVVVTGIKRSKGEFEGRAYDSTKVYVQVDLDDSTHNAKGTSTAEYSIGDSKLYDAYSHLTYPFRAEAEMEIVSKGKAEKISIVSLRPVEIVKAAKAA